MAIYIGAAGWDDVLRDLYEGFENFRLARVAGNTVDLVNFLDGHPKNRR